MKLVQAVPTLSIRRMKTGWGSLSPNGTLTLNVELIRAPKESHSDEKKYHAERMAALQAHYEKLQRRLDAMYEDKLDGRIDQNFYDRKSSAWKKEQDDIFRKIERHQEATGHIRMRV